MQVLLASPNPEARDLARRIYERNLFKRAIRVGQERVNTARMARCSPFERRKEIGRKIADEAGSIPRA